MSIVNTKSFDVSKVSYTEPKTNQHGGKSIYLNYNGRPMTFQTPKMQIPFGLGKWTPKDGNGAIKYSIDLSFRGAEDSPEVGEFLAKMRELDEKLVQDGVKNSLSWFKKKSANEEVMRELYTPLVKVSKDKETGEPSTKYAPTFKVKMPFIEADKTFTCEVYNNERQRVEVEESIVKGSTVTVLMRCTGVWFAGGKYGVSWKAHQIKVTPPAGLNGYSFIEDEQDAASEGGGAAAAPLQHSRPAAEVSTAVEDSEHDDEQEEDEEEQEIVVQKPAPKAAQKLAGKR